MARKIPPFAAMRAFEATARLEKQSQAAEELRISTSAISHQIRSLEAYLGVPLFERTAAGLIPTPEGQAYYEHICGALDTISTATTQQMGAVDETPLKLHMYQSLANLWLIPNLRNLTEGLPDLRVTIITRPETINLSGSDVDAAIVYASAHPSSSFATRLFDEVIVPVCSPEYLNRCGPIDSVEELVKHPLIGSEHNVNEWQEWASDCGVTFQPDPSFLTVGTRRPGTGHGPATVRRLAKIPWYSHGTSTATCHHRQRLLPGHNRAHPQPPACSQISQLAHCFMCKVQLQPQVIRLAF